MTHDRVSITVSCIVNAPIGKIWECWTKPEHITKWCHASADWHAPRAENDLRKGGKFKTVMAAKDGSTSFDFEGTYTEVIPLEHIAYSMTDGRKVNIQFTPHAEGIAITEMFDAEEINSVEKQREGWQAILNNFKKYTESTR